jgi:hypothetical protein
LINDFLGALAVIEAVHFQATVTLRINPHGKGNRHFGRQTAPDTDAQFRVGFTESPNLPHHARMNGKAKDFLVACPLEWRLRSTAVVVVDFFQFGFQEKDG